MLLTAQNNVINNRPPFHQQKNASLLTKAGFFINNIKQGMHNIGLSGNLVGISINLCKSIQKELFINDTP